MATGARTEARAEAEQIAIESPATGEIVGQVAVATPDDVRAAVAAARAAQPAWAALGARERCRRVKRFAAAIADRLEEVADLLVAEAGKSRPDAVGEVVALLSGSTWGLMHGPRALRDRGVGWLAAFPYRAVEVHLPRGVIGLISPWNYPFMIPVLEAMHAFIAGNAVVIKPSEHTPLVVGLARRIWIDAGLPADLFGVVNGRGGVGAALVDSGVDMIHFTGSVAVGRRVGAACAQRLLPFTLELGGKAPAIVTEDAPLERTARALVFGAFFNSGQTCIGVERVYAVGRIAEPLTERVVALTRALRQGPGEDPENDVGAMVFGPQVDVAERHVADAREKGARVLTGGERRAGAGRFFAPTVIAGADHRMEVMREETFGPLLPIMAVRDEQEAVRLANESHLGLNAYVFAGSLRRGERIARGVRAGSVMVGDVIVNYGLGGVPFGGVRESGLGRMHGEAGLRALTETRVICRPWLARWPITRLVGYPYSPRKTARVVGWLRRLFGSRR